MTNDTKAIRDEYLNTPDVLEAFTCPRCGCNLFRLEERPLVWSGFAPVYECETGVVDRFELRHDALEEFIEQQEEMINAVHNE